MFWPSKSTNDAVCVFLKAVCCVFVTKKQHLIFHRRFWYSQIRGIIKIFSTYFDASSNCFLADISEVVSQNMHTLLVYKIISYVVYNIFNRLFQIFFEQHIFLRLYVLCEVMCACFALKMKRYIYSICLWLCVKRFAFILSKTLKEKLQISC